MPKVLIVDDEPVFLTSLGLLLRTEGFEVETAAGAPDAMDVIQRFAPDVLVVDWMLGERVNGIQVAAALCRLRPGLGVIVITGGGPPQLRSEMAELDGAQCLAKPFSPGEFLAAVRQSAERAQ